MVRSIVSLRMGNQMTKRDGMSFIKAQSLLVHLAAGEKVSMGNGVLLIKKI